MARTPGSRNVPADQHRDPALGRLGQRRRVGEPVVLPVVVAGLPDLGLPEPGDDRQLLLETAELLLRERNAVGLVLLLEPARAEPEFDPSAGHPVHLGDLDGEHAGEPEGPGRHQGAEADALGLAGEAGEGDPASVGPGRPSAEPMLR